MRVLLSLWPGVGGVFRYGRWSFLAIALLYGFVFCGLIAANFYWSELLTGASRWGTLVLFGLIWLVMTGKSKSLEKCCRELQLPPPAEKDGFPHAQEQYLQGNWFETECCLNMLLEKNPRDIEALLMLATLYRHKGRCEEAARLLKELELLEDSARWKFEIRSEKRKLLTHVSRKASGSEQNKDPQLSEKSIKATQFDKKESSQGIRTDDNDFGKTRDNRFVA